MMKPPCRAPLLLLVPLLALIAAGCGGPHDEPVSANAQPWIVEALRDDLKARRDPSDGGGRAWIEQGSGQEGVARAGEPGRWTLVHEAGPAGIAAGGMLFFQVSPFWGWSTPQAVDREAPGYTLVSTEASGVTLEPETLDQQLLGIRIGGRRLAAGERIRIVYGAGPAGATADRFAEKRSRFWFAVDGDGDGVRSLIADSPGVDVLAGPPARLVLTLPGTARPGDTVRLTVAVLDHEGNAGVRVEGEAWLTAEGSVQDLAREVFFKPEDGGLQSVQLKVPEEGVVRILGEGPDGLRAESNPLVVSRDAPRVLWGDIHGHSDISDGTGTPDDYYRYARDAAGLDVAALTDHDDWGLQPLARTPAAWEETLRAVSRFDEPGRFVALPGYEWTSWLHGHKHVLFFDDSARVISSVDEATDDPRELWNALRGLKALTISHHSAGDPIAANWRFLPDPELEPVTEVVSVHGSSEAPDLPPIIRKPVAGNFVRDLIERGVQVGFVGGGDGHDGHPGLSAITSPSGGLAAILSEELTSDGIYEALKARRVYATNGARIVLRVTLGGRAMGSAISTASLDPGASSAGLDVFAAATAPLERIDLVRKGRPVEAIPCGGAREFHLARDVEGLSPGDFLYVRAVQADGGAAWSSPFFIE